MILYIALSENGMNELSVSDFFSNIFIVLVLQKRSCGQALSFVENDFRYAIRFLMSTTFSNNILHSQANLLNQLASIDLTEKR